MRQKPADGQDVFKYDTRCEDPQDAAQIVPPGDCCREGRVAKKREKQPDIFVQQFILVEPSEPNAATREPAAKVSTFQMPDGPSACGISSCAAATAKTNTRQQSAGAKFSLSLTQVIRSNAHSGKPGFPEPPPCDDVGRSGTLPYGKADVRVVPGGMTPIHRRHRPLWLRRSSR